MKEILSLSILTFLFACNPDYNWQIETSSPDENFSIILQSQAPDFKLSYQVFYQGEQIILSSDLGLMLDPDIRIADSLLLIDYQTIHVDTSWKPPFGERNAYPEKYHELVVKLGKSKQAEPELEMVLRAYNEGVAFAYRLPAKAPLRITDELTSFAVNPAAEAWATQMSQGQISRVSVNEIKNRVERPLLIRSQENLYLAIGEAKQLDYSRMKLLSGDQAGVLKVSLEGPVDAKGPFESPWRFIMAGKTAGDILENNYLILNLNDPCEIEDTGWMKPGKVIREVSLTTQGGKACVDFAAAHHLQYVHFDAGWYGHEYTDSADATTITVDPDRSKGPLDLHEVIEYAKQKGVEVILYVNRRALEKQLDEILPLYREWGVKGLKYGFVRTGDQQWTAWMHEAVRKAAEYQMVLSIHDDYRPVGYSRTYPNLMTQEGIRGDEESPTNEHTLMTMFTRMIAGAADNTICYFAPRVDEKMGSHASQLAKAVCLYSPLMWLYWYDRPEDSPRKKGGAGGSQSIIREVPELEFFDVLPTVWDETRVIHSAVGELGTIARRSGEEWFVGTVNGTTDHEVLIPLDFLDEGESYRAIVYRDDPEVQTITHVGISELDVSKQDELKYTVKANNGLVIRLIPETN